MAQDKSQFCCIQHCVWKLENSIAFLKRYSSRLFQFCFKYLRPTNFLFQRRTVFDIHAGNDVKKILQGSKIVNKNTEYLIRSIEHDLVILAQLNGLRVNNIFVRRW